MKKSFKAIYTDLSNLYPSIIILLGILDGILPFAVNPEIPFLKALTFSSIPAIIFLFFLRFNSLKFVICAIIGFLLSLYHATPLQDHYDSVLHSENCGATIECVVSDASCTEEYIDWLSMPPLMKVSIHRLRYTEKDKWRKASGKLMVKLPANSPRLKFGQEIELKGTFITPESALFSGDFDFKRYLLSNGIRKIFVSQSCNVLSQTPHGFYRCAGKILKLRDCAMLKITEGIRETQNKKIIATLIFGFRQGLTFENRKTFLRSGTIHIFAISGLHVGMLATILLFLFRWLPFTSRHLVVPLLLLVYVFTTGMPPSAVRTLLMISIWCVYRALLYPSLSLNAIFLAASIILIFNPFALINSGFQFSFLCAGFLVVSWNSTKKWLDSISEHYMWIPSRHISSIHLIKLGTIKYIAGTFMTSLIAWLASIGITLTCQGLFIPSAVFTNFAVLPLVWVLFMTVTAKFFFCFFHLGNNLLGEIIGVLLAMIGNISSFSAVWGGSEYLLKPSLWTFPIFYSALFFISTTLRKKVFLLSASIITGIIIFWYWSNKTNSGSVIVFHGGESQEPSIVICPFGDRPAVVMNAPSWQTARAILNKLAKQGIDELDTLCLCQPRKAFCAGIGLLFSGLDVRHVLMPGGYRRSYFAKNAFKAALESACDLDFIPLGKNGENIWKDSSFYLDVKPKQKHYFIKWDLPDYKISVKIREKELGSKILEINMPNSKKVSLQLLNSNVLTVKEFKIN